MKSGTAANVAQLEATNALIAQNDSLHRPGAEAHMANCNGWLGGCDHLLYGIRMRGALLCNKSSRGTESGYGLKELTAFHMQSLSDADRQAPIEYGRFGQIYWKVLL